MLLIFSSNNFILTKKNKKDIRDRLSRNISGIKN